jgi:DDE superfamily endonuclease
LAPDPLFIEKVRDIVGLYLKPPEAALVLCVDEKTQVQALDRTAPVLPVRCGLPERATHDDVRNGTTNLHAALDVASGKVVARHGRPARATEFRKFLNLIDRSVPEDLDVHLAIDNVSTHETPEIDRWLPGISASQKTKSSRPRCVYTANLRLRTRGVRWGSPLHLLVRFSSYHHPVSPILMHPSEPSDRPQSGSTHDTSTQWSRPSAFGASVGAPYKARLQRGRRERLIGSGTAMSGTAMPDPAMPPLIQQWSPLCGCA